MSDSRPAARWFRVDASFYVLAAEQNEAVERWETALVRVEDANVVFGSSVVGEDTEEEGPALPFSGRLAGFCHT